MHFVDVGRPATDAESEVDDIIKNLILSEINLRAELEDNFRVSGPNQGVVSPFS